jgi:hypothetical protein
MGMKELVLLRIKLKIIYVNLSTESPADRKEAKVVHILWKISLSQDK